ncbi:MAG: hypothetical protein P8H25_04740 [Flavobacteriaceae bacterium]|nr:hypothetical protein [Flavobacteriaceae bacterium]
MNRLVLLGICFVFAACQQKQTTSKSLLAYMPNNALVVAKSNSFQSLKTYAEKHDASAAIARVFPEFFKQIDAVSTPTSGQLSIHLEGKDKLSYVWITHQKPQGIDSIVADTLRYAKTQMLELKTTPPTYYATWDSLHIHSSSKLLVENSIRLQSTINNVDPSLAQLYNSTKEAHTFFINRGVAPLFNALFDGISPVPWNEWSTWTAFVPTVNKSGIYMRAYGILNPNGGSPLTPLANQTRALQELAEYIPASAKSIQAVAFNYDVFRKATQRYNTIHNKPETKLDSVLLGATKVAQIQLGNETVVLMDVNEEPEVVVAQLSKQSDAQYTINGQTVYEFSKASIKKDLLAPVFREINCSHALFTNNYLYLGTSKLVVQSLLNDLVKEDVLSNSSVFSDYAKTLPRKSSLWGWSSPAHFETQLKKQVKALSKTTFGAFRQVDYAGVVEGEVFFVTLSLQQPSTEASKSQGVEPAGTVTFESPIEWGPYAVKNHKTQELEWVIQDENNILYLLDVSGKSLWSKQLDGAILGPIEQVDLYRNKRLQLAFTTTKSFQVLDRNGKAVSGLSKKGMKASSTFAVFDYDKQRDYRILLSSNKSLNMYDRRMKKVSGWQKTKLSDALAYQPKHIRIGNRDYIALVHKSGKVELLHRTGRTRIKTPSDLKIIQDLFPYQSEFVSIDNKNRLVQLSTTGKVTKTALPYETRYTLAANKNTLVTQTENKITINNQLVELDFGVYAPPQIQVVNNRTYILIWDNQSGKVYVYNRDAKLLDSFPVSGEGWVMLGQSKPGSAIYLATRNNRQELRFYKIP